MQKGSRDNTGRIGPPASIISTDGGRKSGKSHKLNKLKSPPEVIEEIARLAAHGQSRSCGDDPKVLLARIHGLALAYMAMRDAKASGET